MKRLFALALVALAVGCLDFDQTTYCAAHPFVCTPGVTSASPLAGSVDGGTVVTVLGSAFDPDASVWIGSIPLLPTVAPDSRSLTFQTPRAAPGTVSLQVWTNGMAFPIDGGFTYLLPPTFLSLSPDAGSIDGGTPVTITGTGFAVPLNVLVGGKPALSVSVLNTTHALAVFPSGAGVESVAIDAPGGTIVIDGGFTYVSPWSPANTGVLGGYVSKVVADRTTASTLYALVSGGGVFKTIDGHNWVTDNDGQISLYPSSLAVDGPLTWLISNSTLFVSDGGSGWVQTSVSNQINDEYHGFFNLAVEPTTHRIMSTATNSQGDNPSLYALNAGQWTAVDAGTTFDLIYSLVSTVHATYADTNLGVYSILPGSMSASLISPPFDAPSLDAVAVGSSDALYADLQDGGGGGGVSRYVSGTRWDLAGNLNYQSSVTIDPADVNNVYAACAFTADAGGQWSPLSLDYCVSSCAILNGSAYCGNPEGMNVATSGTGTFTAINTGLSAQSISGLAVDPVAPSQVYASTTGGVFVSSNGGTSWTHVVVQYYEGGPITIDPADHTALFAGNTNNIYESFNSGASWAPIPTSMVGYVAATSTEDTFYVWNGDQIRKTFDGGFQDLSDLSPSLDGGYLQALTVDPEDADHLVVGDSLGQVFEWHGANWTSSAVPGPEPYGTYERGISAVAVDPHTSTTLYAVTGDALFRWTTAVPQWTKLFVRSLPGGNVQLFIDPASGSITLQDQAEMVRTDDDGKTWYSLAAGLSPAGYECFAVNPSNPRTIFVGTYGGGIWKSTIGGL